MRTLHLGLHTTDLDRSVAFYTAVGYEVVGQVPSSPAGHLVMLKLPADELVTLELVHDPARTAPSSGSGLSHFAIQVESMAVTVAHLRARGIDAAEPESPDGTADFLTSRLADPDGHQIELVQWPPGHAAGLTADDWLPPSR